MELHYGLKQPLRFSTNINHRNVNRKGANANIFQLISPTSHMLPFQLKRDASPMPIQSIKYISNADGFEIELLGDVANNQIEIIPFADYDSIVHFGSEELDLQVPVGSYYIVITDNITTWYSEDIKVIDFNPADLSTNDCVLSKIEYWDTCDIDGILYRTVDLGFEQYKNVIYLDIDIGAPEFDYSQEGEEDGETNFIPELNKLEKIYLLEGVYPEYMVDALSLLPLHISQTGVIEISTFRGYTGTASLVSIEPDWIKPMNVWAVTQMTFVTHTVVKLNCCDNVDIRFNRCLRGSSEFTARLLESSTDYSNNQYTDAGSGQKIALVSGNRVLVELPSGDLIFRDFNGSTYTNPPFIQLKGATYADINQYNSLLLSPDTYYFSSGSEITNIPIIISEALHPGTGRRLLTGSVWNACLVSVYAKFDSFPDLLIGQTDGTIFNTDGYIFDRPVNATHIYISCSGITCNLGDSVDYELQEITATGIGVMGIESTFIVG